MEKNKNVFSNLLWRFAERCGAQGVAFVVSIVLARILDPSVYGAIAIVTVFTNILSVFIDSGFGNALIQKKDADDLDFSSVFYFNIVVCSFLYLVMFFSAPYISKFYKMPDLIPVIRSISLLLIISGVRNIQGAYVSKHMLFKKFFFSTLVGTILAAIVGIVLALMGFGIWALVVQWLLNSTIDTIILWFTVKWRPKKMFSITRLKSLFSFGWKLLISSLLDTGYNNLRSLIIGKIYTPADLAFYNKGKTFPELIITNINSSIDSVLLPAMSQEQEKIDNVRNMTRRAIKTSTYIIMPMMMGLAVCAEPLVKILLTDKWLPSVFFMRVFCFSYAFWPLHTANLNAIKALGRSDIFLKLEIIKKIVGIIAILSTMWISVEAMAYSLFATSILSQIINSFPNKKLLKYSYLSQLKDMLPQISLSVFMGAIVYCVQFLNLNSVITLFIQVSLGAFIYIIGSKLLHIDSFEYLLNLIKSFISKREKKA